jgi:glycosyltransferase involved in cell wall biosynthesis
MGRLEYDVSIVSSGHDVADARLHRHCAALRRAGLTVEVIARGSAKDAPPETGFRSTASRGVAGRAVAAMLLPNRAKGKVLVTLDPDLVPAARALRLVTHGRRLAVDIHEDYAALLNDRAWAKGAAGVVAKAWVKTSSALSRHADLTVVADDHVPPESAEHRLVVRNLPDLTMLPAPEPPGEKPRALYIGDVRASRGLFTMLAAIEQAPGWELDIVGPVAPRDRERLDAWIADSPAAPRVRLHGRRPPSEAWRLAAGAWVGFALLDRTPAFESAIPSKVYEYFATGLPVLTTPIRRSAQLVQEAAAGVVVEDAEQAADALRSWSGADRDGYERLRKGAAAWAQRGLSENPHDQFARAVAELAAQSRRVTGPVRGVQTGSTRAA